MLILLDFESKTVNWTRSIFFTSLKYCANHANSAYKTGLWECEQSYIPNFITCESLSNSLKVSYLKLTWVQYFIAQLLNNLGCDWKEVSLWLYYISVFSAWEYIQHLPNFSKQPPKSRQVCKTNQPTCGNCLFVNCFGNSTASFHPEGH